MEIPPGQKQFKCDHCDAAILVPIDLPPTSAPCPICQQITTSPALEAAPAPVAAAPVQAAPVEQAPVAAAPAAEAAEDRPLQHQDYADEKGKAKGRGAGFLWAIAALAFLALLVGGLLLMKKARSSEGASSDDVTQNEAGKASARELEAAPAFDGVEKEALEVLQRFLTASTVEDKAKYVIGKDATLPEMREFYRGKIVAEDELRADFFSEWAMDKADTDRGIYLLEFDRPKQFKLSELFSPVTDLRTHLSLKMPDLQTRAVAYRENYEMEAVRAMVLIKKTGDELLIDWHTYVQTKERLFREFTQNPVAGREGVFRLSVGEHASTLYEDNPGVRNYSLVDPSHFMEDSAVVTVARNSKNGKLLEQFAWTGIPGKRPSGSSLTLVLKWSNERSPVLQVSKIICWEFLGVGGDPSNLASSN